MAHKERETIVSNVIAVIGNTDKRSTWIGKNDGNLPTYPGPIPVTEVERLLFDWEAISVPTGNCIPVHGTDADLWLRAKTGQLVPHKFVLTEGAQGIVRSDTHAELGRHSSRYKMHDYKGWLIRKVSNILGDTLSILSAILMQGGARAAVEIGLDETMHDSESGMDFWPYLLAVTSLDGSLATTYSAFNRLLRCDNQFGLIRKDARDAGRQYKIKHTSNSDSEAQIAGARHALGMLEQSALGITDFIHSLIPVKVTRPQWVEVMDIIMPPAPEDAPKRVKTGVENRREMLDSVYTSNPMAAPWNGNAWGAVQAYDTYMHHFSSVHGATRLERVYERSIAGKFAEGDRRMVDALSTVLGRELTSVG